MTLNLVEHRSKVEDGKIYTADEFTLGSHYKVERYTTFYAKTSDFTNRIYVSTGWEDARKNYIPDIHFEEDFYGKHDPKFEIQTTAYGALDPAEIKKVIAGYQEAIEAVKILIKTFC